MDNARFDRLEQKIDKLTDAVTAIARVEEKILASNMRLDRAEEQIDKHDEDIDNLAELVRQNKGVAKFADRMFWVIVTGAVGLLFFYLRG